MLWVNQSWQGVYQELVANTPDWLTTTSQITLSTTQEKYDLLDCYKVVAVYLLSGAVYVKLTPWNYDSLDVLKTMQPNTNYIMKYRFISNQLWLHRTPSQGDSLAVYYVPQPTDLKNDNDMISLDVPWNWVDAIIYKVASKCATKLDMDPSQHDKEYSLALDALKKKGKERDQGTAVECVDVYRGLVL